MPLAAGYMKAVVDADPETSAAWDVRILNVRGGNSGVELIRELLCGDLPDVVAFSVLGWNEPSFAALAHAYKQLRPDGLVVFGGTHVANQAEQVMNRHRSVDVIVNGEGERTFRDILRSWGTQGDREAVAAVAGLSIRIGDRIVTSAPAEKILDLSEVPSPILTGAIPLTDDNGEFLYDVALLETNRGCPYHCAFCYWGGAVGQKVRAFPRERLKAEVELLAAAGAQHLVLCDANFGMLPADLEFIEDVIEIRERTGRPRSIDTSWAKNKGAIFRKIVTLMARTGLTSSFTLALQTLSDDPLSLMNRRNMKINDWQELAEWLRSEGLQCYAELVWGSPGETPRSFLDGYDRLARVIPQIATYPLLVLPNTDYAEQREKLGIVTLKGQDDDFDYIVASHSFTVAEHLQIQHFLLWARTIGEHRFFRMVFLAARSLMGMEQSEVLLAFDQWLHDNDVAGTEALRGRCGGLVTATDVSATMRELYGSPAVRSAIRTWWHELIGQRCSDPVARELAQAAFDYDEATTPIYDEGELPADVEVLDGRYYRRGMKYAHDLPALAATAREGRFEVPDVLQPWETDLEYLSGFAPHVDSHEISAKYFGRPVARAEGDAG